MPILGSFSAVFITSHFSFKERSLDLDFVTAPAPALVDPRPAVAVAISLSWVWSASMCTVTCSLNEIARVYSKQQNTCRIIFQFVYSLKPKGNQKIPPKNQNQNQSSKHWAYIVHVVHANIQVKQRATIISWHHATYARKWLSQLLYNNTQRLQQQK